MEHSISDTLTPENCFVKYCFKLYNNDRHIRISRTNEQELFQSFYHDLQSANKVISGYLAMKSSDKSLGAKNNTRSELLRREGNEYFKKKSYIAALFKYNMSLLYAHYESESFAKALGNRSAVYFEIGQYELCLEDIEKCFSIHYDDTLKLKLYIRKASCLRVNHSTKEQAEVVLEEAKNFANSIEISKKSKEDFLQKLKAIDEKTKSSCAPNNLKTTFNFKIPNFSNGENDSFLSASKSISIKYSASKGRHVIANCDINEGEILFIEKPYDIFISHHDYKSSEGFLQERCDHCLKVIVSVFPCKTCAGQMYCQDTCRTNAWDIVHKYECAGFRSGLLCHIGIGNLALRMLLKGYRNGFNLLETGPEADVLKYGDKDDNYGYVCKLVSNLQKEETASLVAYCAMALMLIIYLQQETTFFTNLSSIPKYSEKSHSDMLCSIGGLLVKHLLQISQNANFLMQRFLDDKMFDSKGVPIGVGIYPSISMMNHSCRPNITSYCVDGHLVVKAMSNIKSGEEVFNCYKYNYTNKITEERIKGLERIYHFRCRCTECAKPTLSTEIANGYLCKYCRGPSIPNEDLKLLECTKCFKTFSATPYITVEEKHLGYIKKYILSEGPKNVDFILKALEMIKGVAYAYSDSILDCYKMLLDHYIQADKLDIYSILLYANKYITVLEAKNGGNSFSAFQVRIEIIGSVLLRIYAEEVGNTASYAGYLPKIKIMIDEAERVGYFYYPEEEVTEYFDKIKKIYRDVSLATAIAMEVSS